MPIDNETAIEIAMKLVKQEGLNAEFKSIQMDNLKESKELYKMFGLEEAIPEGEHWTVFFSPIPRRLPTELTDQDDVIVLVDYKTGEASFLMTL